MRGLTFELGENAGEVELAQRQAEKRLPVRQRTDKRAGQRRGEAGALDRFTE